MLQYLPKATQETLIHWYEEGMHLLPHIVLAIVVILISIFIAFKVRRRAKKPLEKMFENSNSSKMLINISAHAIAFICIAIGIIISTSILGLDKIFLSALTGLSFLGLMLAYALKDVAANFFAGIVIGLREPFKKDDMVVINGQRGYVLATDLLFTSVRTPDNQIIYFPNQVLYSNGVINFMSLRERRIVLRTGISYGDDLESAKAVALEAIKTLPFVLQDKPIQLYFTDIGDSSYNFELRFWINYESQVQYREAKSTCIMAVKSAFDKANVCIPYSVTTLDFGVSGGVNLFDDKVKIQSETPGK